MMSSKTAYLELVIGPMFSGKTSKIIDIYKKAKFCEKNVVVINYTYDQRYSKTELSSHDKIMIPCTQTTSLNSLFDLKTKTGNIDISKLDIILINEGQFFNDLFPWVSYIIENYPIHIYICGLDSDYKKQKFGQILDLVPICDKITKLTSWCAICRNGTPGIYSHRVSNEQEQLVIGNDNYISLCRKCYKEKNI